MSFENKDKIIRFKNDSSIMVFHEYILNVEYSVLAPYNVI